MKRIVSDLDWTTPTKSMDIARHWRILVSIFVLSAVSFVVWHAVFPNTLWFMKLWSGISTGGFLGVCIGAYLQSKDRPRWQQTSGRFLLVTLVGWGGFAVVSTAVLTPQFCLEERTRSMIRSLIASDIVSIEVHTAKERRIITSQRNIAQFCQISKHAELFYPSHENSIKVYEVIISMQNGESMFFEAYIPEWHQSDISFEFRETFLGIEILIPGGRKWIESLSPGRAQ